MSTIPSLADQIAVDPVPNTTDRFTSKSLPQRLGNAAPIAYGGCTASVAVHAACKTVHPKFHIYSVLGAFHGPTRIDRKINLLVQQTRNTKTFATRRVIASQTLDDGVERTIADLFIDFHILEPALLTYSPPPHDAIYLETGPTDPNTTTTQPDLTTHLLTTGQISRSTAAASAPLFAAATTYYDSRPCKPSVSGQNGMGTAPLLRTTQDTRPLHDKTSAEWFRAHSPLPDPAANAAALAFIMDGALSFLPLNHTHRNFGDAGACSTLDFALRVMRPGVRLEGWHLRERRVVGGAVGRTFAEARVWDEAGELVAVESQACILRPPVGEGEVKAKM